MNPYRSDLAFIHDEGFGHLAAAATSVLIAELQANHHFEGTIVDLGCGSGITARLLTDAGYSVMGIDLSEALIEIARRRVPEASFSVGSFVNAKIPPCVAVCAIGEVLNYAFDDRNDDAARMALFTDIFSVLKPNGVFLFDVAAPDRASTHTTRTFTEHPDWAVLMEASEQDGMLVRRITTFLRIGDLYRRDSETHHQHLIPPDKIERELQACGFKTERLSAYGAMPLFSGLHGFKAGKASRAA